MFYMLIYGILLILFTLYKNPKLLRFDINAIMKFMAILFGLFLFRLTLLSFLHLLGAPIDSTTHSQFWEFSLVFWEDAAFGITIYYLIEVFKLKKYIWIPITIVLSVIFGTGHLYQGMEAMFITMMLPYFIFYRYGKKYGFGTTMVCHIMYDMTTFLTIKMATLLII